MNQPSKPQQQPETPTKAPTDHSSQGENGVPDGAAEADAKGTPNSDRQDSETAANPDP